MFSGYFDADAKSPDERQLIDLMNNGSLSDDARGELMGCYSKMISAVDPARAIDFLVANHVADEPIWTAAISRINKMDLEVALDGYSKIPEAMTGAKSEFQVHAIRSNGLPAIAPFLMSGGKVTHQVASAAASSVVIGGRFDRDLSIIRQTVDDDSRKSLLHQSLVEGILSGIGDEQVSKLAQELNDPRIYDLSVRQANAIREAANQRMEKN